MAVLCRDIAERAADKLNDPGFDTYLEPEYVNALNAACRVIAGLRVDACVVTEVVQLVAGTRQTIPDGGMQFVGANRNFVSALIPGRAVQIKNVNDKNRIAPYWHSDPEEEEVIEVMPDGTDPLVFWNYPPIEAGARLEIVYSKLPDDIASLDVNLPLHDKFEEAVFHWVLYELFSKDSTSQGHMAKAEKEQSVTYQLLGATSSSQSNAAPEAKQ